MSEFEVATLAGSYREPSFDHATVADAMRPGVFTCRADTSLTAVARTMAEHHVHAVVVTDTEFFDRAPDTHVWGVVTDATVLRNGATAVDRTAGGTATRDFVTAHPGDRLADVAATMTDRGASHAVVVDSHGRPVGMLSTLDVAGIIAWGRA